MRRYLSGLGQASATAAESLPDGLFLGLVERVQYRWHAQKPYYGLVFRVLEPKLLCGNRLTGRLYCNSKALWKLNWFLRDFGYDSELLGRDEIDDKNLVGLRGVVLNLDGFAPAAQWQEPSTIPSTNISGSEVA